MNTQKSISTLLRILLAAVVLGGGIYFYALTQKDLKVGESTELTTLYFPGQSGDTLVSPDNSRSARISAEGKIFLTSKGSLWNKEIVIDVLKGSTTIPGFSVPDYKQRQGDWYASKAYYSGIFAFIGNNRILYPITYTHSVIKNLKTGEEQEINGDVVVVLSAAFLIYSQDSQNSAAEDNHYVLYDIDKKTETLFFPDARKDFASLMQFTMCNNELGFVQYFSNNPNSEEDNKYVYFKFDILNSKLTKIAESTGTLSPSQEYVAKLKSCN